MKIFVTGGAGFIGKNLVAFLVKSGNNVVIYDNFSNSSKKDVENLGAQIISGDITDFDYLKNSINGMDLVIHLAAQTDVNHSISNPQFTNDINVTGTINVLKSCIANGVNNFICTSSAAVYGDSGNILQSEESETIPISPYGLSKLDMEKLASKFSIKYDLNCVSLRLFNVYGNNQSIGVIAKFLKCIRERKNITIFGDGSNSRDFIFVDDVVLAINHFIQNISGKRGDVYNIGTGKATSILELAKLVMPNNDVPIIFKEKIPGDIFHSLADIQKTKEIGFENITTLSKGIHKIISEINNSDS